MEIARGTNVAPCDVSRARAYEQALLSNNVEFLRSVEAQKERARRNALNSRCDESDVLFALRKNSPLAAAHVVETSSAVLKMLKKTTRRRREFLYLVVDRSNSAQDLMLAFDAVHRMHQTALRDACVLDRLLYVSLPGIENCIPAFVGRYGLEFSPGAYQEVVFQGFYLFRPPGLPCCVV